MTDNPQAKRMALEFRIWQHCAPLGWDLTMKDCARALDVHYMQIVWAARRKGWLSRFRAAKLDVGHGAGHWDGPTIGQYYHVNSFGVEDFA